MWDQAKLDYDTLLYYYPDHPDGLQGIDDIIQEYVDLPMIDKDFVEGFIKD